MRADARRMGERFTQSVERARTNVAIDDANRAQGQRCEAAVAAMRTMIMAVTASMTTSMTVSIVMMVMVIVGMGVGLRLVRAVIH